MRTISRILVAASLAALVSAWPPCSQALSNSVADTLANDKVYVACRNQYGSSVAGLYDIVALASALRCVYEARDYRAAELLGEQLIASHAIVDQPTLYMIANSYYKRGNSSKARDYARLAYSRLANADKARCAENVKACHDLRFLLVKIDPLYRRRFALEDRLLSTQGIVHERQGSTTVLDISGSGSHSTETITVNKQWHIEWSYDCAKFADGTGNFQVYIQGATVPTVGVNKLGTSDSGTDYFHHGGDIYLEINSECDWTLKVLND